MVQSDPDYCVNPYFPVDVGTSWTYRVTRPDVQASNVTVSVRNKGHRSFSLGSEGADGTEWECSPEGLEVIGASTSGFPFIGNLYRSIDITVQDKGGITLPANLAPGDQWSEYRRLIVVDQQGVRRTLVSDVRMKASKIEEVIIPAGTFPALRIEGEERVTAILPPGAGPDQHARLAYTAWWAPGVGLVKTIGEPGSSPIDALNATLIRFNLG